MHKILFLFFLLAFFIICDFGLFDFLKISKMMNKKDISNWAYWISIVSFNLISREDDPTRISIAPGSSVHDFFLSL